MKKFLAISLITALICTFSACSDENTDNSSNVSSQMSSSETSAEVTQPEISDNAQPVTSVTAEPATEKQVTETVTEKITETIQTTAESTTEIVPETTAMVTTAEENYNHVDVSEGIVFDTPIAETSDEELISSAISLFESACKTEWDYTVGSPYELDMNQTAQNQFGWDCYLVTTEGINSIADVRADYHKIFSENYADNLEEVFTEADGHVYCLNGARGADIFYEKSVITAVNSRSDSEISFTIQHTYSGDDFGNEGYTSDDEFVISIDSDGAWRVAKFRMPY